MSEPWLYSVQSARNYRGQMEVALARSRRSEHHRGVLHHDPPPDPIVLFSRCFPAWRIDEITTYEGLLQQVARHANDGSLGSFVAVHPAERDEIVIDLFDRWFDGERIVTERLSQRRVAATAVDAVACAAATAEEFREQAANRNAAHENQLTSRAENERARREREEAEHRDAIQLADIITEIDRPDDPAR
jgi:hypothetical protein